MLLQLCLKQQQVSVQGDWPCIVAVNGTSLGKEDSIIKYLANGPKSNEDVFTDGDKAGHNEWTLRDAKKEMGITHEPKDGVYVWSLPEKDGFAMDAEG